jgi:hypothetical protein
MQRPEWARIASQAAEVPLGCKRPRMLAAVAVLTVDALGIRRAALHAVRLRVVQEQKCELIDRQRGSIDAPASNPLVTQFVLAGDRLFRLVFAQVELFAINTDARLSAGMRDARVWWKMSVRRRHLRRLVAVLVPATSEPRCRMTGNRNKRSSNELQKSRRQNSN